MPSFPTIPRTLTHILVVTSLVIAVGSTVRGQVLRWDFRGVVVDVFDPHDQLMRDMMPGDPIEGYFQYAPTSSGLLYDCEQDATPVQHVQNMLTTGTPNFSSISYQVLNPRTNETYSPESDELTYFGSQIFADSEEGLSAIEVLEPFANMAFDGGIGDTIVYLLGETEFDPKQLPRELARPAFTEIGLEYSWANWLPDDAGEPVIATFAAAIFEFAPAPYATSDASNPGRPIGMEAMPSSKPDVLEVFPAGYRPVAISADGNTAVSGSAAPLVWYSQHGSHQMPIPIDFGRNFPTDISGDGSVIVGELSTCGPMSQRDRVAYRWTRESGYETLGVPAGMAWSDAEAVSADGRLIVGQAGTADGDRVYWQWTADAGFAQLSDLPARPQVTSADGRTIVSIKGDVLGPDGVFNLGGLGDDPSVSPRDVSADGTVIVGSGLLPTGEVGGAFRWTEDTGLVPLGVLDIEGHDRSIARAVTADGSVVVGRSYQSQVDYRAFVWDERNGMRDLADVLSNEYGIDSNTHEALELPITDVRAISADGRTLAGISADDRDDWPWILQLDWPLGSLQGDFSGNNQLDAADADALVNAILEASPDRLFDLQRDGDLDRDDLTELLRRADRLPGDSDFDGNVDFADFLVLSNNYGTPSAWSEGDFDASGDAAFPDFLILSANYGKSAAQATSAPEPAGGWIHLMPLTALLYRRRSRRSQLPRTP